MDHYDRTPSAQELLMDGPVGLSPREKPEFCFITTFRKFYPEVRLSRYRRTTFKQFRCARARILNKRNTVLQFY